jgi:hypothetical protein
MRQIKNVWVWVSGNGWGNSVDGGLGLWGVGRASPVASVGQVRSASSFAMVLVCLAFGA